MSAVNFLFLWTLIGMMLQVQYWHFSGWISQVGFDARGMPWRTFDVDRVVGRIVSDQTLNANAITTATANAAVIICGFLMIICNLMHGQQQTGAY
ncbi:MAG: hypothetical protein IPP43_07415 [Chitinophagaceae bacterium]|nr:hypothetical protein [Chitinophagaceae bacterium]